MEGLYSGSNSDMLCHGATTPSIPSSCLSAAPLGRGWADRTGKLEVMSWVGYCWAAGRAGVWMDTLHYLTYWDNVCIDGIMTISVHCIPSAGVDAWRISSPPPRKRTYLMYLDGSEIRFLPK